MTLLAEIGLVVIAVKVLVVNPAEPLVHIVGIFICISGLFCC